MIKSVLVCTDGSENGNTACAYAVDLAVKLKAELAALHVLDARMLEGPLLADISGWLGAQPFAGQLEQFRALMENKGAAIIEAFESMAREKGIEAKGAVKTGHPAQVILEAESRAELIVMGQNGEHADFGGDLIGSIVERVARHSLKPCLITPVRHTSVSKILCAFDGSAHSSRALHEAIELALALHVPLVILTVVDDFNSDEARTVSEEGIKLARAHECPAANLVEEGEAAKVILTRAEELGCNLIVVGAYGHGRIRELVLGSTTTKLIADARVPLMLVR
jgi:nucleotide-binding universal stress UspA family protein